MSVTRQTSIDWTVRPGAANAYARTNNTAVFTYRGGPIQNPGTPSLSDPSTGALALWPPALLQTQPSSPASGVRNISSFWFVTALLVVTIWLESGKRGTI
jgi:hypothetical protein